ncbi:MAG: hypothetical protein PVI24_12325 [Myxococcales bacterium]
MKASQPEGVTEDGVPRNRRPLSGPDSRVDKRTSRCTLLTMDRPGTAAVLSFLVPGLGQLYNGKFLRGIIWLIVTPGLWIGSGGFLGWICHLVSAYMAYQWAQENPRINP